MNLDQKIDGFALPELEAYSAELYDLYYKLKEKMRAVQEKRNLRGAEADLVRGYSEFDAMKEKIKAQELELAALKANGVAPSNDSPPPQKIIVAPIESDEAVNALGETPNGWLARLIQNAASKGKLKLD